MRPVGLEIATRSSKCAVSQVKTAYVAIRRAVSVVLLENGNLGSRRQFGEETLTFQGRSYPFTISGMSLVDIGISSYTGAGKVYDLRSPADLTGTYAATQATFAIVGGTSAMSMKDDRGVTIEILKNEGQESGTQLSVGPACMKIALK